MFNTPHSFQGFAASFFAALISLYPAARSLMLSREAVTAAAMLSYCEFSIIGTGIFLVIQQGRIIPEGMATDLCVAAMLINLLTLSILRIGQGKNKIQTGTAISRGIVFFAVITFSFIAAWIMSFLFPSFKSAVLYALAKLGTLILIILGAIRDFMALIFSYFKAPDPGPVIAEPTPGFSPEYAFEEDAALFIPAELFIIAAAAAVIGLFVLLMRFRKYRIKAASSAENQKTGRSAAPSLASLLLSALKKLIRTVKFYSWLFVHFNTYAGVFIRLEARGKKLGLPRRNSETPREFLGALRGCFALQSDDVDFVFSHLADQIDRQFFSDGRAARTNKMNREKITMMFRLCNRKAFCPPP
jgi:hypothetical protein